MNTPFLILQDANPAIFPTLYAATFLVSMLLFLAEGYRRNYPMITWLAIGVFATFCMIIGVKFANYGIEDWKFLFQQGYLPAMAEKNSMGGLIGLLIGIFIAKRWFRFQPSILDVFALALPIAMIFQRTGCLLTGCCFGLPTDLPWGIQYSGDYAICSYYAATGLAETPAGFSNIIHPVPIYFIICYLITFIVLLSQRNRMKAPGSLGLLGIVLVLSMRFIIEFFRDPVTNHGWGDSFAGLKILQWALLTGALLAATLFIWREKFATLKKTGIVQQENGWKRAWLFALFMLAMLWVGEGWYTGVERLILHVFYTGFMITLLTATFFHVSSPQLRYATTLLTALALLLTSQIEAPLPEETPDHPRKHKLEFAYSYGKIEKAFNEAGCDEPDKYVKSYSTLGLDWTTTKEKLTRSGNLKSNIWSSGFYYNTYKKYTEEIQGENSSTDRKETISRVGFYGVWGKDLPYWGFRIGVQGGNFHMFWDDSSIDEKISADETGIFPILALHIGNRNSAYVAAGLGDELPYGVLTTRYKLGLGIGQNLLKTKQDFNLALGYCEYIDKSAFYLDADIGIGKHLLLSPMVRIGEDQTYGLGLGYKW